MVSYDITTAGNVCGIPVSRFLVGGFCSAGWMFFFLRYNTFNLLCSSSARRAHSRVCLFAGRSARFCVCVCSERESRCRSVALLLRRDRCATVECPIHKNLLGLVLLLFLPFFYDTYIFQFRSLDRSRWLSRLAGWQIERSCVVAARLALLCGFNFHWKRTLSIN